MRSWEIYLLKLLKIEKYKGLEVISKAHVNALKAYEKSTSYDAEI